MSRRPLLIFKFLIIVAIFILTSNASVQAYQYVKTQGRSLVTDYDQDGVYAPYFIKGAGYSPTPISRHPSDWGYPNAFDPRPANIFDDPAILDRDFTLLKNMNANTIRLWGGNDNQQGTRWPNKLTIRTLDKAQQYGLKVIAGFWISDPGTGQCGPNGGFFNYTTRFTNPTVRNDIKTRFTTYVQNFKNHPAILFWALGNENNLNLGNDINEIRAFYSLINELAQLAHQLEGANYHPVALVNGDLGNIGNSNVGASDTQLNYVDMWGSNVYRGISFGTLFSEYASKSQKPFWIAEFGVDAWRTLNFDTPSNGYEDQATQSLWVGKQWDEIVLNKNVTIGGTVMAYSDEWWGPNEWHCVVNPGLGLTADQCNRMQNHFGGGPIDNSCPKDGTIDFYPAPQDNFFNEEWWGLMKISPNISNPFGPDIMTPRQAYTTLQNKFQNANSAPTTGSVSPINSSSVAGNEVVFTSNYADPNGWTNLQYAMFIINIVGNPANSAYVQYNQNANLMYLSNDAGTGWVGSCTPGNGTVLENSNAKLRCAGSSVTGSGTALTVKWALTLKSTLVGSKTVSLFAADDATATSGWVSQGSWTINNVASAPPSWKRLKVLNQEETIIESLYVHPAGAVYSLGLDRAIWKWMESTGWVRLSVGSIKDEFHYYADNNIYGIATNNQVYRWGGSVWSKMSTQQEWVTEALHVVPSGYMYAIAADRAIWKWAPAGWTRLTSPSIKDSFHYFADNNIYAIGSDNRIWRWNGSAWLLHVAVNPPGTQGIVEKIHVVSPSLLYGIGTDRRIWKWNGSAWSALTTPSIKDDFEFFSETNIYAIGTDNKLWRWSL